MVLQDATRAMTDSDDAMRYAHVLSYTGPPELKVVVLEEKLREDGMDAMRYMEYPYKLTNRGGDKPYAEIDVSKGMEVLADYRPAKDFSKAAVDDGMHRIAIKFDGEALEDGGTRKIKGYASLFNVEDRDGEVMMPGAFDPGLAAFRASPALMYNHGLDPKIGAKRIGTWTTVQPDAKGLYVEGVIASGDAEADEVWNLISQGHINALSVGGRKFVDGKQMVRWDLGEISVVSVPANPFSTFQVVKDMPLIPSDVFAAKSLTSELQSLEANPGLELAMNQLKTLVESIVGVMDQGHEAPGPLMGELTAAVSYGRKMLSAKEATEMEPTTAPEAPVIDYDAMTEKLAPALAKAFFEAQADAQKAADEAEAQKAADEEAKKAAKAELLEELKADLKGQAEKLGLGSSLPGMLDLIGDHGGDAPVVKTHHKYAGFDSGDLCFLQMAGKAGAVKGVDDLGVRRALAIKAGERYTEGKLPRDLGTLTHKAWVEGDSGAKLGDMVAAPWAIKADEIMQSDLSGFGDEWVPTLWTSDLWEFIRIDNALLSFLDAGGSVINMPSDPYIIPLEGSDPTIRMAPQAADSPQNDAGNDFRFPGVIATSRVGTRQRTLSTRKLMTVIPFARELEEDSILPILPNLRRQTDRTMMDTIENLIINGDASSTANSNINLIDGTPAADAFYLVADGLRHFGLVDHPGAAHDIGELSVRKIRDMRASMGPNGKHGLMSQDLMLVAEGNTYYALLDLDELITIDKFGPNATVVTGGLPAIDMIRVHVTDQMTKAQTNGRISATAGNNTKGHFVIFNRRQFRVGYRRMLTMEMERLPFADGAYLVASQRVTVQARDSASDQHQAGGASVGFNVNV